MGLNVYYNKGLELFFKCIFVQCVHQPPLYYDQFWILHFSKPFLDFQYLQLPSLVHSLLSFEVENGI